MSTGHDSEFIIIGGGAVGLATALALSREHGRTVAVLEAERTLAPHQTSHNSGVIHAGLYYRPGSLRATLCATGREAMYEFCTEQGLRFERCGKVVAAVEREEIPRMEQLAERGRANGLTGIRRLSGDEVREIEPHVRAVAGLFVPDSGIVDFAEVTRAFARVVQAHGGQVRVGEPALRIGRDGSGVRVESPGGVWRGRMVIVCGGLQADRLARRCGLDPQVQIIPFRGEYYELTRAARPMVRNLIYPVPNPKLPFLGVHLTRMVCGDIEVGPSAVLSLERHGYARWSFSGRDVIEMLGFPGFYPMAARHWKTGVTEVARALSKRIFLHAVRRLVPDLTLDDLVVGRTGVRAMAVDRRGNLLDDFSIVRQGPMVHVLNAPSPAATASIAIGRYVADLALSGEPGARAYD